MRKTILFVAIIGLTGCSSSQYLKPNPNSANAKLRLVSIPSNNNFIHEASDKGCFSTNFQRDGLKPIATLGIKANLIRSLSRIAMPAYNENISDSQQNEVYIPAEQPFSFQFNGVGISGFVPGKVGADAILYSWCRKIISFTPKADANYEAVYDYVDLPNGKETCGVKLFEIIEASTNSFDKAEVKDYQVIGKYCER